MNIMIAKIINFFTYLFGPKVETNYEENIQSLTQIDNFTCRQNPIFLYAFYYHIFINNLFKFQTNKRKTIDFSVAPDGNTINTIVPEDGKMYFDFTYNQTRTFRYVFHIINVASDISLHQVIIYTTNDGMSTYRDIVKPTIERNYESFFSDKTHFRKFVMSNGLWKLKVGKRSRFPHQNVNKNAQSIVVNYVNRNIQSVNCNNLSIIMLVGDNCTGKTESCLEIAVRLDRPLYEIEGEFTSFQLRSAFDSIPNGSIIDVSDIAWKFCRQDPNTNELIFEVYSSITKEDLRYLVNNTKENTLTIFSSNKPYIPFFTKHLPGFIQRFHLFADFDKKNGEPLSDTFCF